MPSMAAAVELMDWLFKRVLRYSAYADAYQDSLTYSDSELEDAYGADRNTYDHVSYEVVSFSGAAESTTDDEGNTVEPTEEEAAAALEAGQDLAQPELDGMCRMSMVGFSSRKRSWKTTTY